MLSKKEQYLSNGCLFTIITVCYNSEAVISKTIESVLAQDYDFIEYLIIDGASTDRTIAIAENYRTAFRDRGYYYDIYSEPDRGIYDAMNKGIRKANGEIVGIINSGDWYEQNAVSISAKTYKEIGYDYFYADLNIVRINGDIIVKRSRIDRFPTSRHWNHPTSFVRKVIYDELGEFRCNGIYDDFEFLLRVRKAGKKVVVKNEILANFMMGGVSNEKDVRKCIQRCIDRYKCYKMNGYHYLTFFECVSMEIVKLIFY